MFTRRIVDKRPCVPEPEPEPEPELKSGPGSSSSHSSSDSSDSADSHSCHLMTSITDDSDDSSNSGAGSSTDIRPSPRPLPLPATGYGVPRTPDGRWRHESVDVLYGGVTPTNAFAQGRVVLAVDDIDDDIIVDSNVGDLIPQTPPRLVAGPMTPQALLNPPHSEPDAYAVLHGAATPPGLGVVPGTPPGTPPQTPPEGTARLRS